MISIATLNGLQDDELQTVIEQCQGILKQRDEDRKIKALNDARTLLASVGLSLKDLNGKSKPKVKGAVYHAGHTYQHPTNKALLWNARGQKPHWLRELEAEGGKAAEIEPANDNVASVSLRKTG
jgi:H-NS histone family